MGKFNVLYSRKVYSKQGKETFEVSLQREFDESQFWSELAITTVANEVDTWIKRRLKK